MIKKSLSRVIQFIFKLTNNCIDDLIDNCSGDEYKNNFQITYDFILYLMCELECVGKDISKADLKRLERIRLQFQKVCEEIDKK